MTEFHSTQTEAKGRHSPHGYAVAPSRQSLLTSSDTPGVVFSITFSGLPGGNACRTQTLLLKILGSMGDATTPKGLSALVSIDVFWDSVAGLTLGPAAVLKDVRLNGAAWTFSFAMNGQALEATCKGDLGDGEILWDISSWSDAIQHIGA